MNRSGYLLKLSQFLSTSWGTLHKTYFLNVMSEQKSPFTVVVTGDVTMDWNIAHRSRALREPTEWTGQARSNMNWQFGSAALLADLIMAMKNERHPSVSVIPPDKSAEISVNLNTPSYVRSYAIWDGYIDKTTEETEGISLRWRVQRFLGLDLPSDGAVEHLVGNRASNDPASADIVVIDDSNLGFRNKREHWPQAINCNLISRTNYDEAMSGTSILSSLRISLCALVSSV